MYTSLLLYLVIRAYHTSIKLCGNILVWSGYIEICLLLIQFTLQVVLLLDSLYIDQLKEKIDTSSDELDTIERMITNMSYLSNFIEIGLTISALCVSLLINKEIKKNQQPIP